MKKKIIFGLLALFLGAALIYGCGQTSTSGSGVVTPSSQSWGIVMGTVSNEAGSPITSGVNITVTSSLQATALTAESNAQGWFSISNVVPNYPVLVTFSKTGYVTTYKVVAVRAGQSVFINATLLSSGTATLVTLSTGLPAAADTSNGVQSTITLPAGVQLLNANGTNYAGTSANVSVRSANITDPAAFNAFPGEFVGQSLTAGLVEIASFGYITASITDISGNPLSLAGNNQNVTITIQVPTALQGSPPATIPLWYFDPATRTWIEQGSATYSGGVYTGTVTHLSTWNFDVPIQRAYISGTVKDTAGNPVPNAQVYCNGINWKSGDYGTASDGTFTSIRVAANETFTIYAQRGAVRSAVQTISPITAGQEMTGVILVLDATKVTITLTWGANPSDEDSHLTVPQSLEGVGQRYDLFYNNRYSTPTTRWPSVGLDTDDTSSYGPEVSTIYKLYKGTYRFNVHHYKGSGNITTSTPASAVVFDIPSGAMAGIRSFSPPASGALGGSSGTGDVWQVFDFDVDASGNITAIRELGTYLNNVLYSDHDKFSPGGASTAITASGVRGAELFKTK